MPIRPIDLQTISALAKEVERIQATLQQRSLTEQQQFATQIKHEADSRQAQVNASPKSESSQVNRDKENAKRERERQRGELAAKESPDHKVIIDDDEDHQIDVRI